MRRTKQIRTRNQGGTRKTIRGGGSPRGHAQTVIYLEGPKYTALVNENLTQLKKYIQSHNSPGRTKGENLVANLIKSMGDNPKLTTDAFQKYTRNEIRKIQSALQKKPSPKIDPIQYVRHGLNLARKEIQDAERVHFIDKNDKTLKDAKDKCMRKLHALRRYIEIERRRKSTYNSVFAEPELVAINKLVERLNQSEPDSDDSDDD